MKTTDLTISDPGTTTRSTFASALASVVASFGVLGIAITLMLLQASPAQAGNPLPLPLDLTFNVSTEGASIGKYAMSVGNRSNVYTLTSTLKPSGLAQLLGGAEFQQESRFYVRKGRVVPLTYREHREGREPPKWALRFDWATMQVTLPDGNQKKMPRQPLDPAVAPLQVIMTPPSPTRELVVNVVNDRGVRRHTFTYMGEETIETALGKLRTINVQQRKHGAAKESYIDIWLAPDKGWIPVRIIRRKKSRDIEFDIASLEPVSES